MSKMLIDTCCLCNSNESTPIKLYGLSYRKCRNCGVIFHEVEMTKDEYFSFYEKESYSELRKIYTDNEHKKTYHTDEQRYNHDYNLAIKRIDEYKKITKKETGLLLDIGAANGAFVDCARSFKYDAFGTEINDSKKFDGKIFYGELDQISFGGSPPESRKFDLITMHDVLEHMINPKYELGVIKNNLIKTDGMLIIDFPEFYSDHGVHHWKQTEHLWILTMDEVIELVSSSGFKLEDIKHPVSSKFVLYFGVN